MLRSVFFDLAATASKTISAGNSGWDSWLDLIIKMWLKDLNLAKKYIHTYKFLVFFKAIIYQSHVYLLTKKKNRAEVTSWKIHILSMKVNMTQNYGYVIQPLLQPQQTTASGHLLLRPHWLPLVAGTVVLCSYREWCQLCLREINKEWKSVCVCVPSLTLTTMFFPPRSSLRLSSSLQPFMVILSHKQRKLLILWNSPDNSSLILNNNYLCLEKKSVFLRVFFCGATLLKMGRFTLSPVSCLISM